MKDIAENFVTAVLTAVIVSFMTLSIPKHMLITIVTLLTFIPCRYLVAKIVMHVRTKMMPNVYQWVRYVTVLLATVFMITGFVFENMTCAIFMIVFAVVAIIAKILDVKKIRTIEKKTEAPVETSAEK